MSSIEKRHVGKDVARSDQPRVEPAINQIQAQHTIETGNPSLPGFPARWFWSECAKAQLRTLSSVSVPAVQGLAMWRYCICLAVTHGDLERWTGYTADVIKGHASHAQGSHRWRRSYLQSVVDFTAVWVPLALEEAAAYANSEILQVESD